MVKVDRNHTMMFNDRLKELTIRSHITETLNAIDIYNAYSNLAGQLNQMKKSIKELEERVKELEPHFLAIKEEVEKGKKDDKQVNVEKT